jgi:hypothetical protein
MGPVPCCTLPSPVALNVLLGILVAMLENQLISPRLDSIPCHLLFGEHVILAFPFLDIGGINWIGRCGESGSNHRIHRLLGHQSPFLEIDGDISPQVFLVFLKISHVLDCSHFEDYILQPRSWSFVGFDHRSRRLVAIAGPPLTISVTLLFLILAHRQGYNSLIMLKGNRRCRRAQAKQGRFQRSNSI